MDTLAHIGIFLIKLFALVAAILLLFSGLMAISQKNKGSDKNKLKITQLNEKYQELTRIVQEHVLGKKELKKRVKSDKKQQKAKDKAKDAETGYSKRVFVLDFDGDIRASACKQLRQEITALIKVATTNDEVVCRLESPGGVVHGYGFAASQLARLRDKNIPLTVCVDKVAASGGYLMAAIANTIVAAPYAIVGSIGVVAQFPNFNRLLKKHYVDYEMVTAGEYKRTLTMLGQNTHKGRKKFLEELEAIHGQFKNTISQYRPQVNIDDVATGEHWLAEKAFSMHLVDKLSTSDDYLLELAEACDIYHIQYRDKKKLADKFIHSANKILNAITNKIHEQNQRWWG